MVCDYPERNVDFFVIAVLNACRRFNRPHNVPDSINLKETVHTLHKTSKALKPHTGINIRLCKTGIVIVAVIIKLCKHKIPKFHEAIAVTAGLTVGRTAAVFNSAVKVYFGTGTAGTGAVFPKIILLAQPYDMGRIDSDLVRPNIISLIVFKIHRNPKLVLAAALAARL